MFPGIISPEIYYPKESNIQAGKIVHDILFDVIHGKKFLRFKKT